MLPYNSKISCDIIYKSKCCVSWNRCNRIFCVKNSIKQGGVLSPILFCVYVDEFLKMLKESGYGCYIGNIFPRRL
jgi:hypothetical protein